MPASPRRVAILGGNRIPFVRSNGLYAQASNSDMLAAALDGLIDRYGLTGEQIGEVAAGAVLKHRRDFNMVREVVLGSRLANTTPAVDLQQACGTGLQATIYIANKIALGQIDVGISGGVDTTSDAPLELGEKLTKKLVNVNTKKGNADRIKALLQIRPGDISLDVPKNGEPRTGLSMGEHQAITAKEWGITREAQDELTVASHQHLAAAYDRGFFDDLITPYLGVERDQNLRPGSTVEKLATLKPVFGGPEGTMTAGNSTPLSDGASTVLLASEEWAKAHDLPILAYFTDAQTAAVGYVEGEEGLLMAPAYAVPQLLDRNNLTFADFDFFEIHEAFAAQVLSTLKAWEDPVFNEKKLGRSKPPLGKIDRSKLNVNGGSLAAAHPFAATGGRIVAGLAKALDEKGGGRGLISICAAGGVGVVAIVER